MQLAIVNLMLMAVVSLTFGYLFPTSIIAPSKRPTLYLFYTNAWALSEKPLKSAKICVSSSPSGNSQEASSAKRIKTICKSFGKSLSLSFVYASFGLNLHSWHKLKPTWRKFSAGAWWICGERFPHLLCRNSIFATAFLLTNGIKKELGARRCWWRASAPQFALAQYERGAIAFSLSLESKLGKLFVEAEGWCSDGRRTKSVL